MKILMKKKKKKKKFKNRVMKISKQIKNKHKKLRVHKIKI